MLAPTPTHAIAKATRMIARTALNDCKHGEKQRIVDLRCSSASSSGVISGLGGGSASSRTSAISHVASPSARLSTSSLWPSSLDMAGVAWCCITTRSGRAGEGDGISGWREVACAPAGKTGTPCCVGPLGRAAPIGGSSFGMGCRGANPSSESTSCPFAAVCPGRSGRSGLSGASVVGALGGGIIFPPPLSGGGESESQRGREARDDS
mmetsp:Transcript_30139/g.82382  ORF Transcript_30139/g.82382 Transcript_30139/m.82382 type:complete len:208 (-) Transcript_30139:34-657(-)